MKVGGTFGEREREKKSSASVCFVCVCERERGDESVRVCKVLARRSEWSESFLETDIVIYKNLNDQKIGWAQ